MRCVCIFLTTCTFTKHTRNWTYSTLQYFFATLGSNLEISTLLEILQSCKLDQEVALFSDWYPPTHPTAPLGRNWITTIGGVSRNILKWAEMCLEGILKVSV